MLVVRWTADGATKTLVFEPSDFGGLNIGHFADITVAFFAAAWSATSDGAFSRRNSPPPHHRHTTPCRCGVRTVGASIFCWIPDWPLVR